MTIQDRTRLIVLLSAFLNVTEKITKSEEKLIKKGYQFHKKCDIVTIEFFFFHFHMMKDKAVSVCVYIADGF